MKKLITLLLLIPIFTYSQHVYKSGKLIPTSGSVHFIDGDSLHFSVMVVDTQSVMIKQDSMFCEYDMSLIDHFRYTGDNKIIYFDANSRLRKLQINKFADGKYAIKKGDKSLIVGASSILVSGLLFTLSSNLNKGSDFREPIQIASGAVFVFGASITLDGIIKRNKHYKYSMRHVL